MSETIPDDIHSTAVRVVNTYHDNYSDRSLYDIVTEALLAERERAAKIAEDIELQPATGWGAKEASFWQSGTVDAALSIAKAIRS